MLSLAGLLQVPFLDYIHPGIIACLCMMLSRIENWWFCSPDHFPISCASIAYFAPLTRCQFCYRYFVFSIVVVSCAQPSRPWFLQMTTLLVDEGRIHWMRIFFFSSRMTSVS